jgi:hypothetical protein
MPETATVTEKPKVDIAALYDQAQAGAPGAPVAPTATDSAAKAEPQATPKDEPKKVEVKVETAAADEVPAETGKGGEDAKDAPAKAPEQPAIPAELVEEAKLAGLADADIAELKDAASLRATIAVIDRQAAAIGRAAPQQEPGKAPEPPKQAEPAPAPVGEFKVKLNLEDYDDNARPVVEAVTELRALYAALAKSVAPALEALPAVAALDKERSIENAARESADFDDWFNARPEGWSDLFGKGSEAEVGRDKRSAAWRNRSALAKEAYAIGNGYLQQGRSVPPIRVLCEKACRQLFGDKYVELERKRMAAAANGKTFIAPPQTRRDEPTSGKSAAVTAIGDLYRQYQRS